MIDPNKLQQFITAAKAKGYKDEDIASLIQQKSGAQNFNTEPTSTQTVAPEKSGGVVGSIANFLTPRIKGVVDIVTGGYKLGKGVLGGEDVIGKVGAQQKDQGAKMRELALMARNENDPLKKAALLAEGRSVSAGIEKTGGELSTQVEDYRAKSGITEGDLKDQGKTDVLTDTGYNNPLHPDMNTPRKTLISFNNANLKFASRKSVGVMGEAATWLMPTAKALEGASLVQKVMTGMANGAASGAVSGITDTDSSEEWWKRTMKGAGAGAATGGVIAGVFGAGSKIKEAVEKRPVNMLNRIIGWAPSETAKFKHLTGLDPSKEIVARDVQNWKPGMTGQDLVDYFVKRKNEVMGKLDDALTKQPGGVAHQTVIEELSSMLKKLAPEQGNIGTSGAVEALQLTIDDIAKWPTTDGNLTWVQIQSLKTKFQGLGESAFGDSGTTNITTSTFASVSDFFKRQLEKGIDSEDVKNLNQLTQLYDMAYKKMGQSIVRGDKAISGDLVQKLLQSFPAMAGLNAIATTSNPVAGAVAVASVGGLQALRTLWNKKETQIALIRKIKSNGTGMFKNVDMGVVAQGIQDALTKKFSQQNSDNGGVSSAPTSEQTAIPGAPEAPTAPEKTYDVKNSKTGEIIQVPESGLKEYGFGENSAAGAPSGNGLPTQEEIGLAMLADLQATGGKNITELKAIAAQVETVNGVTKETNSQRLQESLEKGLGVMENLYFSKDGKSLSIGKTSVGITGVLKAGEQSIKKITNQELSDKVKSYNNMRSLAAGLVNQARGAGVLNAGEYEVMMANMPTEYSSEKSARDWFTNIREMLVKNPFIAPQGTQVGVQ